MKRVFYPFVFALLGVAFCVGWPVIVQSMGNSVQFPSPRGETDFSTRFNYFLFGVCPSFFLIGWWIGSKWKVQTKLLWLMPLGIVVGSFAVEICVRLMEKHILSLQTGVHATHAVAVMFTAWVLFGFFGAWLAYRLTNRSKR
jgi:hypothetical protein